MTASSVVRIVLASIRTSAGGAKRSALRWVKRSASSPIIPESGRSDLGPKQTIILGRKEMPSVQRFFCCHGWLGDPQSLSVDPLSHLTKEKATAFSSERWGVDSGLWTLGLIPGLNPSLIRQQIHPYSQRLAEHIRNGFIGSPAISHAGAMLSAEYPAARRAAVEGAR